MLHRLLPRENAWLRGNSAGTALVMHWYRTSMWPAQSMTMTDPDPSDDRPADPVVASADAGVVLVVDDEPAIVESLTKIFKREGLHVLGATDGTAGLELLRKHRV